MATLKITKQERGHYYTTMMDDRRVDIESRTCEITGGYWIAVYENDHDGDETHDAKTKKALVDSIQRYNDNHIASLVEDAQKVTNDDSLDWLY